MGWIHGDIKSNNVVVKRNSHSSYSGKVIDFGLSKQIKRLPYPPKRFNPEDFATNHERYPHIAPEILRAETGDTLASESYSVGRLLCDVATVFGRPLARVGNIGTWCCRENPERRPSMEKILGWIHEEKKREVGFQIKVFLSYK